MGKGRPRGVSQPSQAPSPKVWHLSLPPGPSSQACRSLPSSWAELSSWGSRSCHVKWSSFPFALDYSGDLEPGELLPGPELSSSVNEGLDWGSPKDSSFIPSLSLTQSSRLPLPCPLVQGFLHSSPEHTGRMGAGINTRRIQIAGQMPSLRIGLLEVSVLHLVPCTFKSHPYL